MTRRAIIVLLASLIACLFGAPGALAGNPSPPAGSLVDVVRYTTSSQGVVRHDILVDSSVADPQTAADQIIPASEAQSGPGCQSTPGQGEVVAQFCINPWSWTPANIPVKVYYNPTVPPGDNPPSALEPIMNAIQQWSSVTPAFSFVYEGTTSAGPTACGPDGYADGINDVVWVDGFGSSNGILAQTCTLQHADGTMLEFDMEINARQKWSALTPTPVGYFDLYSNVLHEFGHAAGIAHSQYGSAVMFASLLPSIEKRALTLDDKDALIAKYGGTESQLPLHWIIGGLVHD